MKIDWKHSLKKLARSPVIFTDLRIKYWERFSRAQIGFDIKVSKSQKKLFSISISPIVIEM